MSFEWRTDEDEGWSEEGAVKETAVPHQSFLQRRWRFLLLSLLGLLSVWLVVRWQINQRVAETTATIETELLATHNFVLQTAVSQDESLFRANLSGRNPNWSDLQKTMVREGWLLDRPMLGWQHVTSAERLATEDVTLTLDPGLRAAELQYPQTYAVQISPTLSETITLQQTAVYRQGTNRWLYAPPEDDFWGDWITYGGDYLTLVYPERDRDVAALLGIQLDRLLGQMCAEMVDLNCGPDFQVFLRLDTDPNALLALTDIETMLRAGVRLELPTPTLVGVPTDELSAEMLYRAYGVQVATAVLAHQIEYDCCRHELFFRALRDYQLDQLGLQPWPLTPAMYRRMLDIGFDGDVARHWTRRWEEAPPQFLQVWLIEDPDPIWQQVYMLVAFLAGQETAVSPTQMMRLMDRNSYDGWLADVLQSGANTSRLESRFLLYINSQAITGQQAEPPIPLPDGQITLVCQSYTNGPNSHVYSYDLASQAWTDRFSSLFTNAYLSTPDGEHFIVNEYSFVDGVTAWKISLATDNGITLLEEAQSSANNEYWVNYSLVDEEARYLVRYEYVDGDSDISVQQTSCLGGDCPAVSLPGNPIFAPDKAHLLAEAAPTELINVGVNTSFQLLQTVFLMTPDGTLRQLLGQGGASFWLNDTVYGFARLSDAGWEVVTAVTSHNQPRYLFSEAELLAEIPADERPESVAFTRAVANRSQPKTLLVQLRPGEAVNQYGPDTPGYLFKLTLTNDLSSVEDVQLLRTDDFSGIVGFGLDGRTIILGNYGYTTSDIIWYFLDPETGQTELTFKSNASLASTEDGQWVVQLTDNYLLLRAPAHDYQQMIPHSFEECDRVVLSAKE